MKVARAEVEGDPCIGGFKIFHLDDGSRQAVRYRHIHGARQGDRHVARVNRDRNPGSRFRVDFGHAKLEVAEEKRREPDFGMVVQDARFERGG